MNPILCNYIHRFILSFDINDISFHFSLFAFGMITVISLVVISLYTGLSQGMQPLISQNHGAEKKETVHTLLNYSLITSILLSMIIYGIIFFRAPALVSVFNSEQDLVLSQYAISGLKLYFTACPFIGFNMEQGKPGQNTFD